MADPVWHIFNHNFCQSTVGVIPMILIEHICELAGSWWPTDVPIQVGALADLLWHIFNHNMWQLTMCVNFIPMIVIMCDLAGSGCATDVPIQVGALADPVSHVHTQDCDPVCHICELVGSLCPTGWCVGGSCEPRLVPGLLSRVPYLWIGMFWVPTVMPIQVGAVSDHVSHIHTQDCDLVCHICELTGSFSFQIPSWCRGGSCEPRLVPGLWSSVSYLWIGGFFLIPDSKLVRLLILWATFIPTPKLWIGGFSVPF